MHPFSVLTLGIFVAGYITARWDLVTRLYELAIFAWDHSVVVSWRILMSAAYIRITLEAALMLVRLVPSRKRICHPFSVLLPLYPAC